MCCGSRHAPPAEVHEVQHHRVQFHAKVLSATYTAGAGEAMCVPAGCVMYPDGRESLQLAKPFLPKK